MQESGDWVPTLDHTSHSLAISSEEGLLPDVCTALQFYLKGVYCFSD